MFVIGRELFLGTKLTPLWKKFSTMRPVSRQSRNVISTEGRYLRFLSRYDSCEMTALGEKGNYTHFQEFALTNISESRYCNQQLNMA
jgi:hypothetical protein